MSYGQTPKWTKSRMTNTQLERFPRRQNQTWAESRVDRTNSGHILLVQIVMWPDSQNRQNSSRQPPSWTDSQEHRAKREQNPQLIVSIVKTILLGQNVMLPDSQYGQNSSRQTTSWTDFKEDGTKFKQKAELIEPKVETILRGQNVMWPDSLKDRIQVGKHPVGEKPK